MRIIVPKWVLVCLSAFLAVGCYGVYHWLTKNSATGLHYTQNYRVDFKQIPNWNEEPANMSSLFCYRNPKSNAILRGGVTQIVSDYNPTPELDTDGIAEYYVGTTEANQRGWTVQRLPDVETHDLRFAVLDRRHPGKRIITCFCVKGNTTLVVGMSGYGESRNLLDDHLADLKAFLSRIEFVPTVLHYPSDEADLASN